MSFESKDLAQALKAQLVGENRKVKTLSPPNGADDSAAVVLFKKQKLTEGAALLVLEEGAILPETTPYILVKDARLALAELSELFNTRPFVAEGRHTSAVVDPSAFLAEDVHLSANVYVGAGASIGKGCRLGANVVIGENVTISEGCILHANVSLYPGVQLGRRVYLHSGVVIGSDGFGYAPSHQGAKKIHHLGTVVLEDDVEIGANSCVDRATLGETRIGARTKIDNLCQIGHNVTVGTDCLIAGTSAIAGSTTLGDRVLVGGGVGMVDHVEVGSDVRISARSLVTKPIPAGESWAGNPAQPYKKYVRERYLLGKLEGIWQAVKSRRA